MIGSFIKRRPTVWDAYVLSWVSLVCTVAAFFAGLVISISARSAATLGYALENWVDSLSSILVLWRFWGGGKTVPEEQLAQREKRASIAVRPAASFSPMFPEIPAKVISIYFSLLSLPLPMVLTSDRDHLRLPRGGGCERRWGPFRGGAWP